MTQAETERNIEMKQAPTDAADLRAPEGTLGTTETTMNVAKTESWQEP